MKWEWQSVFQWVSFSCTTFNCPGQTYILAHIAVLHSILTIIFMPLETTKNGLEPNNFAKTQDNSFLPLLQWNQWILGLFQLSVGG